MEKNTPEVWLVSGFLEGGKTTFIRKLLENDYKDKRVLLVLCEAGEEELKELVSEREELCMVICASEAEVNPDMLEELRGAHAAETVIIEHNLMWNPLKVHFPNRWQITRRAAVFDGSTLENYLTNMGPMFGPMLRYCELVEVNRCDDLPKDTLGSLRRRLRAMQPAGGTIILRNRLGVIAPEIIPEMLPYDLSSDPLVIAPQDFGIWFFDVRGNYERYRDKRVVFTGQARTGPRYRPGYFAPGRQVMTCCEADMAFMGFVAYLEEFDQSMVGQWFTITARMDYRELYEYGGEGPLLLVEGIEKTSPIIDNVLLYN